MSNSCSLNKSASVCLLAAFGVVASVSSNGGELVRNDGGILKQLQMEDPRVTWDIKTIVHGDFDCDGNEDTAILGYSQDVSTVLKKANDYVRLALVHGTHNDLSTIEFGLKNSMDQASVCDSKAILSIENLDYDLKEEFGSNPDGFVRSKTCKGLNIRDPEWACDSFHIFWNHKTRELNWWRR